MLIQMAKGLLIDFLTSLNTFVPRHATTVHQKERVKKAEAAVGAAQAPMCTSLGF